MILFRRSSVPFLAVFLLAGCVSVPRDDALKLATAGQQTTTASRQPLTQLANQVGGIAERQLVRAAVEDCHRRMREAVACEARPIPPEALTSDKKNTELAAVILQRAAVLSQLNTAYAALAAEANYNAQEDLEGATKELTGGVNALAVAVSTLTGGVALSAIPFTAIAEKAAGESAEAAQRRRLIEGSEKIQTALERLLVLLKDEADYFNSMSATLASTRATFGDSMLEVGLISPLPLVTDFVSRNELGSLADLEANDPRARVAAQTIWRYRAVRTSAETKAAYSASIKALEALIAQHEAFQRDRPLSLDQITAAISELTVWAELVAGLSTPAEAAAVSTTSQSEAQ